MSVPNPQDELFLFGALMDSTADSIYFKDRECRLLRVSRKMAKDLGFSDPAELIGRTDIDLFGEAFGQTAPIADASRRRFSWLAVPWPVLQVADLMVAGLVAEPTTT